MSLGQSRVRKATNSPLGEDRIPYREGYKRAQLVKTNERIGNLTQAVRAVVGWKP